MAKNVQVIILTATLLMSALGMKITDETSRIYNDLINLLDHEVLIDVPDKIDAVKESEIHDDDNHNIDEADLETQLDDEDYALDTIDDQDTEIPVESYYNAATGEYVEEVNDPEGRFHAKTVVKEGPGYTSVTFMSSGSSGDGVQIGPGGGIDSMFEQMLSSMFGGPASSEQQTDDNKNEGGVQEQQQQQQQPNPGDPMGIFDSIGQIMQNMQKQQMEMMNTAINTMQKAKKANAGSNPNTALVPSYNTFLGNDEEETNKESSNSTNEEEEDLPDTLEGKMDKLNKVRASTRVHYVEMFAMFMFALLFIVLVIFILTCKMNAAKNRQQTDDFETKTTQEQSQSQQQHEKIDIAGEVRKKDLGKKD